MILMCVAQYVPYKVVVPQGGRMLVQENDFLLNFHKYDLLLHIKMQKLQVFIVPK